MSGTRMIRSEKLREHQYMEGYTTIGVLKVRE